ncbi:hypothetical protein BgiMline_001761, partial [Biomphalaria glabrata]
LYILASNTTDFTPQFCTSQPPTRLTSLHSTVHLSLQHDCLHSTALYISASNTTVFTPQLCTSQPPTRLTSLHSSVHLSLQHD